MDCALPAINPPPASQGGVFVYILTYAAGSQILPPGHEVPALAPWQLPDAPQYALLVNGSTHLPAQSTSPCWHAY